MSSSYFKSSLKKSWSVKIANILRPQLADDNIGEDGLPKNLPHLNEEDAHKSMKLGAFDVWALGIALVIGGQYFSWNFDLSAGSGSAFISVFLIGLGYLCLCLCNAEMTSALPFAGGAYGMARVSLGFYAGFIVGCSETGEYILYVASSGIFLCQLIASVSGITSPEMIPVMCLAFYVSSTGITILGGYTFWRFTTFLAIVSLLILIMYILGSLPWVDVSAYASSSSVTGLDDTLYPNQWFIGGMEKFMNVLSLAPWFYVGIESLNMATSVIHNVRNITAYFINGII